MFKIKSYGKSELAMLYFPNAMTPTGALSSLQLWIRQNRELSEALRKCGMPKKAKTFTPKEVSVIIEFLGEP